MGWVNIYDLPYEWGDRHPAFFCTSLDDYWGFRSTDVGLVHFLLVSKSKVPELVYSEFL